MHFVLRISPVLLLSAAVFVAVEQKPPDPWQLADRATVRFAPDAFPDLPVPIREELRRRACSIPQSFGASTREGVISGAFYSEQEIDRAVLCSIDRRSSVLVFRGGRAERVEAIKPPVPDEYYVQTIAPGTIGFSRTIRAISAEQARRKARETGEFLRTLAPRQDCIEDIFIDKASSVYCWVAGKWIVLAGAN